jgi:hypothetical protein
LTSLLLILAIGAPAPYPRSPTRADIIACRYLYWGPVRYNVRFDPSGAYTASLYGTHLHGSWRYDGGVLYVTEQDHAQGILSRWYATLLPRLPHAPLRAGRLPGVSYPPSSVLLSPRLLRTPP